ncbi:hypothetical protein PIB30_101848, partial [Stylosanthes scabra]|nr:hypothetical protein [Stylosanthes scabra]
IKRGKLSHASKVNRASASQAKRNTPGKPIRLKVNGPKATQGLCLGQFFLLKHLVHLLA